MDILTTCENIPTPCYVVDEAIILKNLQTLKNVSDRTGCKILLAQKAFSFFPLYPKISKYLFGTTASGLFEAKLGHDFFGGETHIFSPAYKEEDFAEISSLCNHIVFNSFSQLKKFRHQAISAGCSIGLRVNPRHSTQKHAIYDPCSPGSRLGVPAEYFEHDSLNGVSGLHFHTLCEQGADALSETLMTIEEQFGKYLYDMEWINFGGGHHITKDGYDIDLLCSEIIRVRDKYNIQVYLEPGEAIALNSGWLITTVLDTLSYDIDIAILDTSAACHMPDVLEMPYRPPLEGSGLAGEKNFTYRLGGPTCLAGDIIGDYSFDFPLKPGDRLAFGDMAIYSMVKNNTFNGTPLPSIALRSSDGEVSVIRKFGYEDFKTRLG